MKILIIDCRSGSRKAALENLLRSAGHEVSVLPQIDGKQGTDRSIASTIAHENDVVLLHANPDQKGATWALRDAACYANMPVLLFSGGRVMPQFFDDAERNPLHSVFPVPLSPSTTASTLASGPEGNRIRHFIDLASKDAVGTRGSLVKREDDDMETRLNELYSVLNRADFQNQRDLEAVALKRDELLGKF